MSRQPDGPLVGQAAADLAAWHDLAQIEDARHLGRQLAAYWDGLVAGGVPQWAATDLAAMLAADMVKIDGCGCGEDDEG